MRCAGRRARCHKSVEFVYSPVHSLAENLTAVLSKKQPWFDVSVKNVDSLHCLLSVCSHVIKKNEWRSVMLRHLLRLFVSNCVAHRGFGGFASGYAASHITKGQSHQ